MRLQGIKCTHIFQSAYVISIKYILNDLDKFGVNIREITNYFIDFGQESLMSIFFKLNNVVSTITIKDMFFLLSVFCRCFPPCQKVRVKSVR